MERLPAAPHRPPAPGSRADAGGTARRQGLKRAHWGRFWCRTTSRTKPHRAASCESLGTTRDAAVAGTGTRFLASLHVRRVPAAPPERAHHADARNPAPSPPAAPPLARHAPAGPLRTDLNSRTSVRRPMAVRNAQPFPMTAGAEAFRMPFEKKKNPCKQAAGQASGRARQDRQVRRMSAQPARS